MEHNLTTQEIDKIIKESINACLNINPKFNKTDTLIVSVYTILKNLFIDNIDYVFLEAPTGSGKSVIGYLIHFCYVYITRKIEEKENFYYDDNGNKTFKRQPANTYLLTSSKMLQEQLDGDITTFNLDKYLIMIKGIKNYECEKLTNETKVYTSYADRFCIGMDLPSKENLECYPTCKYIQTRIEASQKDCTILNYSYFLNVLKNPNNPYFGIRSLTIADEAHLIPDIVLGMYNVELTQWQLNKLLKLVNQIEINFGKKFKDELFNIKGNLGDLFQFFTKPNPSLNDIKKYILDLSSVTKSIVILNSDNDKVFASMFEKEFRKLKEDLKNLDKEDYIESLEKRPEDIFIKSENLGRFSMDALGNHSAAAYTLYKHFLYDLSESELCRKYFISKINKGVFMSATLGNIEEFAQLMGLNKDEYKGFRLESNFDFSKSPIFLTKSGYLNYQNFQKNIDKIIFDAIRICEHYHPNDKGIIHTSTFSISNILKQAVNSKLGGITNTKRYLFYENSQEKEACIELIKSDTKIPYIIIGPSLYEGIDLKADQGRFNIIVKTPYSGMDEYIKKKMERYPFWYTRQTLEKLVQSIGRTNRFIDDWSKVYILDSVAEKLVYQMPKFISDRLKYFKI